MVEETVKRQISKKIILFGLIAVIGTGLGTFSITYLLYSSELSLKQGNYNELLYNYQTLTGDYDTIYDNYQDLLDDYNSVCSLIKQQILPIQYGFFAEAVRRYYLPQYLNGKTGKTFYKADAEFCRDIILHDSDQANSFQNVANAFADALKYGSDTMGLCDNIMSFTYYDWLPNWGGYGLTGNELTDIDTIHQWCIDEVEYEYDTNITYGQESPNWDYIKFSVETAFRCMGDCEDQAILDAAYLESCGFDTAVAIFHDPSHPTIGEFYHGVCLVHLEDTSSFQSTYPSCNLWRFGSSDPYYPNFTWCFLDPTWDVAFGSEPTWLQDYSSLSFTFMSVAFCDIGGAIL